MRLRKAGLALCVGFGAVLVLCGGVESRAASEGAANEVSSAAPISGDTSGTVVETMDTAGYTYVLIDTGEAKVWFAAPGFTVAVGDRVTAPMGAEMREHYSKTLDRTFDVIYFVGWIRVGSAPLESTGSVNPHAQGGGTEPASDVDLNDIPRVEGGKTVAEIFDAGSELAGKQVTVRGRVVKYTPRILGTNFIHLQDGSSNRDGRNDLTVTTTAEVEVGDLVIVRGLVSTDKDFGSGYVYDLIVEDASVTVE